MTTLLENGPDLGSAGHAQPNVSTSTSTPGPDRVSRRAIMLASTFAFAISQLRGVAAQEATPAASGPPPGFPGNGTPPAGGPPDMNGDAALAEEFVGVTTDGNVIPGLFPIQATGVSTEPVVEAAAAFLASLTDDQRAATLFAVDDLEWRKWANFDSYPRQGVSLREMSTAQRAAAFALMTASLSAEGMLTAHSIMLLNHTQCELMNNFDQFDEDLYWFTVMGEPSKKEPWGWQVDGHHLVVNYFVLGDQVVMSPCFWGSEPTVAPVGTDYAGVSVLQPEQNNALAFVLTLSDEQRAKAIVDGAAKTEDLMIAGAFSDNAVIPYAGIVATDLTDDQRAQLLNLIDLWIGKMDDGHAKIRLSEVEQYLDETWFAWVGETALDSVFYYRIQSPVILVEFDHQRPGPLGRASDFYNGDDNPSRFHIHAVVRTPNGNDYGKDLLAEHYATSPHHQHDALARVRRGLA